MKKEFVTYEIALKLKELGFDEVCFGYYTLMKDWMISTDPKYNTDPHFIGPNWCTEDMKMRFMYVVNSFGDRTSVTKNSNFTKAIYNVAAPLWQQVIDWFREKHNMCIEITYEGGLQKDTSLYSFQIWSNQTSNKSDKMNYYKCREKAILKAIELCKEKKN